MEAVMGASWFSEQDLLEETRVSSNYLEPAFNRDLNVVSRNC